MISVKEQLWNRRLIGKVRSRNSELRGIKHLKSNKKKTIRTNQKLALLPTGGGGGGLFGLSHQTVSHNSRILSSRLPKLSDFSFLLFGHIAPKFQVNRSSRGVAAVIFQTRGHEKSGV